MGSHVSRNDHEVCAADAGPGLLSPRPGRTAGHLATHQELTRCFNRRDWSGARTLFADDASYTDHGQRTTLKGLGEIADHMRQWGAAYPDGRAEQPRYLDAGCHTVCLFHARGRNDGRPLPGVAPTHKRVDVPFCEVLTYDRQGRIVAGELFYDCATLLAQLGIMEPPQLA